MKKICLIDYDMSVRGGVEQVTASLANALTETYEVHLLSLCQGGEVPYLLSPKVHYRVLLEEEERLRVMQKKLHPLLKQYFKENNIVAAIVQGNYPGFLVAPLRFSSKTKLIFCDHGALMNQWERKDIVFIRFLASLLCHRTVTLTEQSRADYCRKFFLSKKKVLCIYNWIDLSLPHSSSYSASSQRFLSAGRFGPEKGFDVLIKAFAPAAKRHPEWSLDLFGDGEMMPTVKALVEEYGLSTRVNLLGMRSDLAERYGDYAFYVLPSHREGMPLVLLEAKANRLPILAFDVMTGPREIVRDGVDGILVPPEDVEELTQGLLTLMEDPEKRRAMSARSQENLDKFSKETILAQWVSLLDPL